MKKQTNLKNLINKKHTIEIRKLAQKSEKIKITINIDRKSLDKLKLMAFENGGSYQKILNQILIENLDKKNPTQERLDRLEKEIQKIKKMLAA